MVDVDVSGLTSVYSLAVYIVFVINKRQQLLVNNNNSNQDYKKKKKNLFDCQDQFELFYT